MIGTCGRFILVTLFLLLLASFGAAETGRIYGKIFTDRGDVLEGVIRWDKNEGSWDDMIDGTKEREYKDKRSKRKKYSRGEDARVSIFGITIYEDGNVWSGSSSQAAISFGYIKRLTNAGGSSAELLLKNGQEIYIKSGSTDLGNSVREIVIETTNEGELELEWDDIDYIEFFDGGDIESNFGRRIYGTVETDRGGEFTGWICWDMDELFSEDIIDGRDRSRKRKIKFADIASIEKVSSQASEVTTKDGKAIRLDDSNDVDSGNRGIVVSDHKMGRVVIKWDEFERLDIVDPPREAVIRYGEFPDGDRIFGTVFDEDGEEYTGYIRWDNDEEYGWEVIDGDYRGIDFDIQLDNIKSIEKLSRRSSRVTLWDGRSYRLRDSNDINDENKGILVFKSADSEEDEIFLDWEDFNRIEFKKP